MKRVAILGATGYSARELIHLLLRHPEVEITVATSRQEERPRLDEVHRNLTGRIDLRCENLTPDQVAERAEYVFCCLPHGVTTEAVPQLLNGGAKVIDLSADYRLRDPNVYAQWYNQPHGDSQYLGEAVYGLPELFAEQIKPARLIANPGCYPTSASLALAPLLMEKLLEPTSIIIDSKSGVSGAGRTPKLTTLYPECNESISAYNVGQHRHTPEIEQTLSLASGQAVRVIFTPHLVPMDRGILSTIYAEPLSAVTAGQVLDVLTHFYRQQPFVQVVEHLPSTKETIHTNRCHITARVVNGRVLLVSCLDNLIKGAAGAAVQNFNLINGFPQETALV